jgi:hypothetical protein
MLATKLKESLRYHYNVQMDIFDSHDDKNKDTINVCKIKVKVRDYTMQICAQ